MDLTVWQESDEDWFLDDLAIIFIIPSLQELYLSDLMLCAADPKLTPGLQGQRESNLESLWIRDSYIDITAIKNMLEFPRALTRLVLQHYPPRVKARPEGWSEEERTLDDLYQAIAQHRESLEVLMLKEPPANASNAALDPSQFPRLKKYNGVYKDSSGTFNFPRNHTLSWIDFWK